MTHFLTRIGLAGLISVASLAGLAPVAAHADDFGIEFRSSSDRPRFYDDGPRDGDEFVGRRHFRRDREEARGGCFPGEALRMARYQGLRHARIGRITPRVVVVNGRSGYGWERIVFANVRGCPVIDN